MWRPKGDSVSDGCVTRDDLPILVIRESYRVTQDLVVRQASRMALDRSTRQRMQWAAGKTVLVVEMLRGTREGTG